MARIRVLSSFWMGEGMEVDARWMLGLWRRVKLGVWVWTPFVLRTFPPRGGGNPAALPPCRLAALLPCCHAARCRPVHPPLASLRLLAPPSRSEGGTQRHSLLLTPADWKVDMLFRIAAAAFTNGQARRAPVPSPSRISRSRRGSTFRAWSMASWPRSPERWAKSRASVMSGLALMAAMAAAVAMKPSMMTRRLEVAARRMAAAIMTISKPPYSVSAAAASSRGAVRSAALVKTSSLCWTPSGLSPVPGPTRSESGRPKVLWAMIDADAVLAMPISPKQMASGEPLLISPWEGEGRRLVSAWEGEGKGIVSPCEGCVRKCGRDSSGLGSKSESLVTSPSGFRLSPE